MIIHLLTLVTILLSKSLYYETYGRNFLLIPFLFLLSSFYFISVYDEGISNVIKKQFSPDTLLLFSLVSIVFLSEQSQLQSNFVFLCNCLMALVFTRLVSFKAFSESYVKIMKIIALLSLLSIVAHYYDVLSPFGNFTPTDERPIRNFVFFGIDETFIKYNFYRNIGIWWEPGAFQAFLSVALVLGVTLEIVSLPTFLILALAILTTKSTTGFLVLLIAAYIYGSKLKFRFSKIAKLLSFGILCLYLVVNPEIFEKFQPGSSSYISFLTRFSDFKISMWVMTYFPLWGYGFGNLSLLTELQVKYAILMGQEISTSGTDGLTMFLSQVGFLSIIVLGIFLNPKYMKGKALLVRILFALAILCIFNTQNLTNFPVFMVLLFYSLDSFNIPSFKRLLSNLSFKRKSFN